MSMTQVEDLLKGQNGAGLAEELCKLQAFLDESFRSGAAIHEVERGLWDHLLRLGRTCLEEYFARHGTGDMGESVSLPNGDEPQRLEELHRRPYISIFGRFQLERTVYGSREGQKIEFVPLDNRLSLPASGFSYVLQDWDQSLCAEEAFNQSRSVIKRILKLNQSVDSLEQMNRDMAEHVESYMISRPVPPAEEEGDLVIASADGKGIVMRRESGDGAAAAHRTKGEKASQKKMATVGTVYTADRYVRTPEQVLAALFREEKEPAADRPKPQHKRVWASLPQDDGSYAGEEAVFTWMDWELRRRNPKQQKETVYICDGQVSLWGAVHDRLPQENAVEILDLLHVTPRLWKAAHVFHAENSQAAEKFVRERLLRVLQGKVSGVIRGLREMATKHGVKGSKKKTMTTICNYLENNQERMRYDTYLAAGYPIASGVIEGACRHLVKDRMERAGMHWKPEGAQAMLNVRSIHISDTWEEYQQYRIECETERLYPYREAAEPMLSLSP